MRKIFSFCNQKGGVGKTTSVVNMGAVIAALGRKTLIVDLDPQGNATSGLGIEKPEMLSTSYQLFVDESDPQNLPKRTQEENLDLIPANADLAGVEIELMGLDRREFRLKEHLQCFLPLYDFILIDCPPSLGMLTINALTASDSLVIPLQCEYYALEGLGQLLNTYKLVEQNLNHDLDIGGVILTMADFRTNLTQQVIEEVRNYFHDKVFQTVIPRSVKISEAPSFGKPVVTYDAHNRGAKCYQEVGAEFVSRFGSPKGNSIKVRQEETTPAESSETNSSAQEQPVPRENDTIISAEQPMQPSEESL